MKYGLNIPNLGVDARTLADLAHDAEEAGWDGAFVFDSVYIEPDDPAQRPMCDPWIALAAMATRTERIRLGPLVTPLPRRRPWKVARETVTLDHLSGGRLILPVGLGAVDDGGFLKVGEALDRRTRAELLDESLAILTGLWSGQPFSFHGEHYQVEEMTFLPPPVQSPRIPIWVIGAWRSEPSLRRALRWDGIMPIKRNADGTYMDLLTPDDLRALRAYVAEHRGPEPYDIVYEGESPGDDPGRAAATVLPYADAGATWWIESVWASPWERGGLAGMRARIHQGPPRID